MTAEERDTQRTAVFLIILASVCIAIGSHFGWRDLVAFATFFGGAGVGILKAARQSSLTNKDGGTINVNPTEAS